MAQLIQRQIKFIFLDLTVKETIVYIIVYLYSYLRKSNVHKHIPLTFVSKSLVSDSFSFMQIFLFDVIKHVLH